MIVVGSPILEAQKVAALRDAGCEVFVTEKQDDSICLEALLREMGRRRWTNILVEGGSGVLGSFVDARAVDEFHVFLAPRIAGGAAALTPVGGKGVEKISAALDLARVSVREVDGDVYLHGIVRQEM
jgi:diaminohydroxyphosphoribosylaminopyrimidine deaminase/5-amino-6-(5-phosphoribosylamino)uracil reductase